MPELTARQRAFALALVGGDSAAEAARKAGYSKPGARVAGNRLLRNVTVSAEIRRLQGQSEAVGMITLTRAKELAATIAEDTAERAQSRLQALVFLARVCGWEQSVPLLSMPDGQECRRVEICFIGQPPPEDARPAPMALAEAEPAPAPAPPPGGTRWPPQEAAPKPKPPAAHRPPPAPTPQAVGTPSLNAVADAFTGGRAPTWDL